MTFNLFQFKDTLTGNDYDWDILKKLIWTNWSRGLKVERALNWRLSENIKHRRLFVLTRKMFPIPLILKYSQGSSFPVFIQN